MKTVLVFLLMLFGATAFSQSNICFHRLHQGHAEMLIPVNEWNDSFVTLKIYHPNGNLIANPVTYALSSLPKVTSATGAVFYYLKGISSTYGGETLTYELSSNLDAAVSNTLSPLPQGQWSSAGAAGLCGVSKASVCFSRLHQGHAEMLIPASEWHDTSVTLKVYHPNSYLITAPITYSLSSLPKVTSATGVVFYYLKGISSTYGNETLTYELSSNLDAAVSNTLSPLPQGQWSSAGAAGLCGVSKASVCFSRLHQGHAEMLIPASEWHDTSVTLKVYHPNSYLITAPITYSLSSLPKVTSATGAVFYYLKGISSTYGNETLTYELSSNLDAAVSSTLSPLPQGQWSSAGAAGLCGVSKASVCFSRLHQGHAEMLIPASEWHDTTITLKVYHPNSYLITAPITYSLSSLPKVTSATGAVFYYLKGISSTYGGETLTYELSSNKDAAVSNTLSPLTQSQWNDFALQNTCVQKPKGMCIDRNYASYTIYLQKTAWNDTAVQVKLYHTNSYQIHSQWFTNLSTAIHNNMLCYKINLNHVPYSNENVIVEVSSWKNAAQHMYMAPQQQLCFPPDSCTNPSVPAFTQIQPVCKGTVYSLPAISNDGYTGSWAPVVNSQVTTTYTFTPDSGQCAAPAVMTVSVKNGITWTSGSSSQSVATGTAITPVVYTLANDASNTVVTGLPAGVTYAVSGNILTISGNPAMPGTFGYTVSVTTSCGVDTATGTILATGPVADWTLAPNSYIFTGKDKNGNDVDGLYIPVKKAYAMWAGGGDLMKDAQGNYTPVPSGTETAGLYWEDEHGLVKSVHLEGTGENAKIKVMVDKLKEGNAVISYRVNGEVYWTWHVWVTDDPTLNGSTYHHGFEKDKNGNLVTDWKWMDRNLGATNAHFIGHDWQRSGGLQYEWGRKDPFPPMVYKDGSFYEITGEVGSLRHRNAIYKKSVTSGNGQAGKIPTKFRGSLYTQDNTESDLPNENIRYSIKNPIDYIIPPVYIFKLGQTVANNGENYFRQVYNSQGQVVWIRRDLTTWFSKQKYKVFDPANLTNNIAWDLWGDTRQGRLSNINSSDTALVAASSRYAIKSPYDPCPCNWRVPSAYSSTPTYPHKSSPWGTHSGLAGGNQSFTPDSANMTAAGIKIYPGLGYDFSGAANWNLGIMPISGNYEYYPNHVSLSGTNPASGLTVPYVVSQDHASDGGLHTATFSSGYGTEPIYGTRGIGFIADPGNRNGHTSIGWYYMGYDGNEGNTYESAAVRCIKDPNAAYMPAVFETEFVAAATGEYSLDTLKAWTEDPNSFVVMTNTAAAADRTIEIPLRKAYAMHKLYLTTDESYPSGTVKSASVIWTTNTSLIRNIQVVDGSKQSAKLVVTLDTNQYGNAVVAFHLGNSGQWINGKLQDPVIWSWHIWAPETPVQENAPYTTESIANNGIAQVANNQFVNPTNNNTMTMPPPLTTTFMDRDLGALTVFPTLTSDASISAADLLQVMKSSGVHYQWGRKDALPRFTNPANLFLANYRTTGGNAGFDHFANGTDTAFVFVQNGINNGAISYQKFNETRFMASSGEYQAYKTAAGVDSTDAKNIRVKKVMKYAVENPLMFLYQARPLSAIEQNPTATYTEIQRDNLNRAFVNAQNKKPADWLSDESALAPNRWGHAAAKSPFDPCPKGWRIPDLSYAIQGATGASPWFYNHYDTTINGVRVYGFADGGSFDLTGRGKNNIVSNTNNMLTQAEYPGNVISKSGGVVGSGSKRLGNVFSFTGSNYSIGNFANSGFRGLYGGNTSNNPFIFYEETAPTGYATGLWTAAFADSYYGRAIGLQMGTRIGLQALTSLNVSSLYHPQTAMSCRCARINYDASGKEIARYDPNAIPVPPNTARKASNTFSGPDIDQVAKENKVIVFPNPVKDVLRIRATDDKVYYYQVYNMSGQLVLSGQFINMQTDVSSLIPGAYLVRINDSESLVKIIKQ